MRLLGSQWKKGSVLINNATFPVSCLMAPRIPSSRSHFPSNSGLEWNGCQSAVDGCADISSQGPPAPLHFTSHCCSNCTMESPTNRTSGSLSLQSRTNLLCWCEEERTIRSWHFFPREVSWLSQNSCPTSYSVIKHSLWSVRKADSSQLRSTAGSYRTDHSHVLKKIGTLQKPEEKNAFPFYFFLIKLIFSSNSHEEHFTHMKS